MVDWRSAMALALGLWSAAVSAQPGPYDRPMAGVHESGDWSLACDNANTCTAISVSRALAREYEQSGIGALPEVKIWIRRAAGPDAPVRVIVDARVWGDEPTHLLTQAEPDADLAAAIHIYRPCDGDCLQGSYPLVRVAPAQYQLAPAHGIAFVRETVQSDAVATSQPSGGLHSIISTLGLPEILRRMDDWQFRSGTVTAILNRGDRPADEVQPAPALPEVGVVRGRELDPVAVTSGFALDFARAMHCDTTRHDAALPAQHFLLDDGHHLWGMLCGSNPFNPEMLWLISDADQNFTAYRLPRPDEAEGADQAPSLPQSSFDPDSGILTGYSGGLCGWQRSWAWTGNGFAMVEARAMPSCMDLLPADRLVTYRAIAR